MLRDEVERLKKENETLRYQISSSEGQFQFAKSLI